MKRTAQERAFNQYRYYTSAAKKAAEPGERVSLARGLTQARDIYAAESWRVFYEEHVDLGQMLKATERNSGTLLRGTKTEPRDNTPTLAELGIDKKTSSLAQKIADLPPKIIRPVAVPPASEEKQPKKWDSRAIYAGYRAKNAA